MKKIFLVFTALALTLCMAAACAAPQEEEPAQTLSPAETAAPDETPEEAIPEEPTEAPTPEPPADSMDGSGDFYPDMPTEAIAGNGKVDIYPMAPDMRVHKDIKVAVQDGEGAHIVGLYSIPTNPKRNFPAEAQHFQMAAVAMFDMEGAITITAAYAAQVESVTVRPARAGITAELSSNSVVTFTIDRPGYYSVEINDDPETNNLLIFANPPHEAPSGARVIEGAHAGDLTVADGETVYMAPGSVVRGKVYMGSNSVLTGRGIVTESGPATVEVHGQTDITLEGIAILDPNRWVVEFRDCDDVKIDNIKIISARDNGDGITIQSSSNMTIENSFVRSWDDSIVLKNYTENNCFNITVRNCVIWTDLAQSLEIGFETNKGSAQGRSPSPNTDPQIYDILFEDIDIIHAFHKAPISIHNADSCRVYNITYRNIIVDNALMGRDGKFGEGAGWAFLIDIGNGHSFHMGGADWTHNEGDREISNVLIENVWVLGGNRRSCGARFINKDSEGVSVMEDIVIKNVYYEDTPLDFTEAIEIALLDDYITQSHEPYFSIIG